MNGLPTVRLPNCVGWPVGLTRDAYRTDFLLISYRYDPVQVTPVKFFNSMGFKLHSTHTAGYRIIRGTGNLFSSFRFFSMYSS